MKISKINQNQMYTFASKINKSLKKNNSYPQTNPSSKIELHNLQNDGFTSKTFDNEEVQIADFVLSLLEMTAKSREKEISDYDTIPSFFEFNISDEFNGYEITKQVKPGFFDKISELPRYKKIKQFLDAGLNREYYDIAKLNYIVPSKQIPLVVLDDIDLSLYRHVKTTRSENGLGLIHTFKHSSEQKKLCITQYNFGIASIILSSLTPKGEYQNQGYYFAADGKINAYRDNRKNASGHELKFKDKKIIASEFDAKSKLKLRKIFLYDNGKFVQERKY